MCWQTTILNGEPITYLSQDVWLSGSIITNNHFPAWSLHRLIEMMPESLPTEMTGIQGLFHISRHSDMTFTVGYTWSLDMKGSLYDVMISAYEWLIKEGYFNKEYLV